jgi:hypothetical protein
MCLLSLLCNMMMVCWLRAQLTSTLVLLVRIGKLLP